MEGCAGANEKASPPGRQQRCTFRPTTFSSVRAERFGACHARERCSSAWGWGMIAGGSRECVCVCVCSTHALARIPNFHAPPRNKSDFNHALNIAGGMHKAL